MVCDESTEKSHGLAYINTKFTINSYARYTFETVIHVHNSSSLSRSRERYSSKIEKLGN